jgi:tetratricopeptide (TPR) repeat protein
MRYLIIMIFVIASYCNAEWFAYDRAIRDVQRNDLSKAMQRLNASLIDRPDDASLLYDAGVVAYKSRDFNQARDYFNRAQQGKGCTAQLRKQAYFNSGNASVALADYKNAVESYEQALHLDPSDQRVQHNLKKARELLLREQQKEQDKEQQNQKDKQDKQGGNQSHNKGQNDQDKRNTGQDGDTQDKSDRDHGQQRNDQHDDTKSGEREPSEQGKDGKSSQQQNKKNTQRSADGRGDPEQRKDDKNKQEHGQDGSGRRHEQESAGKSGGQGQEQQGSGSDGGEQEKHRERGEQSHHKQGNQSDDTHEQGQRDKRDQKQSDRKPADTHGNESKDTAGDKITGEHGQTPSYKQQSGITRSSEKNDTQQGDKAQAMKVEQGESSLRKGSKHEKKVDERLMWIMREQERRDAQYAKGLIRGMVDRNLAGKDGQHCW